MPGSSSVGSKVCETPTLDTFNPSRETTDWRAVCGKTARTVLREGRLNSMSLPYPYHPIPYESQ